MQRKPGASQRAASPAAGFIKSGQPFWNSRLSEQDANPFPPGDNTTQSWEQFPNSTTQSWEQFSTSKKNALRNNALAGLTGTRRRDMPSGSLFQKSKIYWSSLSRKRRILISVVSVILAVVIVVGVIGATFVQNLLNSKSPLAAPPTIQVSIDALAMHNLIAQAVNPTQDGVDNINIVPMPDNGVKISFTMLITGISGPGINRRLPMEIDATLGGTTGPNKNILTVNHFIRDGVDAGPDDAANMTTTMNQLLKQFLPIPGTNTQVDIASVFGTGGSLSESDARVCGNGSMLLQLGLPVQTQPGHILPINVDSYIGLDQKGNIQFHLDRVTYNNGQGIGSFATNVARQVIRQILSKPSSPSSSGAPKIDANNPLNQIKFLSLSTNMQSVCGKNDQMIVINLGPAPGK